MEIKMRKIDYFEPKSLRKLANKQSNSINNFLAIGHADNKSFSEKADTLSELLEFIEAPFLEAYVTTGRNNPSHTAVYNLGTPHILTTAVNVLVDNLPMFEVFRFIFEIMQLKEYPSAIRLTMENPACGYENMNILYQRIASPSMATNEQYDDYIAELADTMFQNLGCTAGTDHLYYDWELKAAE
jgi:hypothetical protein